MSKEEIETKLQKLRDEWKVNPERRFAIELQAKCLKKAMETIKNKTGDIFETAKQLFK